MTALLRLLTGGPHPSLPLARRAWGLASGARSLSAPRAQPFSHSAGKTTNATGFNKAGILVIVASTFTPLSIFPPLSSNENIIPCCHHFLYFDRCDRDSAPTKASARAGCLSRCSDIPALSTIPDFTPLIPGIVVVQPIYPCSICSP